jgi:putative transposase
VLNRTFGCVRVVPLQQAIRHQQAAYTAFFAKRARYPRFKSRQGRQGQHPLGPRS